MEIVKPSVEMLSRERVPGEWMHLLETAGRLSWKSEGKMTADSGPRFIRMLIAAGHESVLEHVSISAKFIVDRGISHEIVRHRIASFTQESTRYCNYKTKGVVFIEPPGLDFESLKLWTHSVSVAEATYLNMLDRGISPQIARSVLPNSLKTEIVVTTNLREWRHIFKLRTAKAAHPQMREVMIPLLEQFRCVLPVIFEDIIVIV